jgi:hypothetical protein
LAQTGSGEVDMNEALRVKTIDGKYTVILENDGKLRAERYNQPWRECVGDGLILALAQDIEIWSERAKATQEKLDEALAALHDIHITAHCIAKAGPANTPTLQDAWAKFMKIAAMATNASFNLRAGQLYHKIIEAQKHAHEQPLALD